MAFGGTPTAAPQQASASSSSDIGRPASRQKAGGEADRRGARQAAGGRAQRPAGPGQADSAASVLLQGERRPWRDVVVPPGSPQPPPPATSRPAAEPPPPGMGPGTRGVWLCLRVRDRLRLDSKGSCWAPIVWGRDCQREGGFESTAHRRGEDGGRLLTA